VKWVHVATERLKHQEIRRPEKATLDHVFIESQASEGDEMTQEQVEIFPTNMHQ